MINAYLSLGSNLGDRKSNLSSALKELNSGIEIQVKQVSQFYETTAESKLQQADYLNCACEIQTILSAEELLKKTQDIEKQLGRDSKGNYDPRTIDIDILFYNETIIATDTLIIPHPSLHERSFVLTPLNEIAPNLIHPLLDKKIHDLYQEVVGY